MPFRSAIPCLLGLAVCGGFARAQVSDNFYKVFPSRVHTAVKASYDPDDRLLAPNQGNDDGFSGINLCEAYRYLDNGTPVSVLAHFEGREGVMGLFFRNFWSDSYNIHPLPGENNRTRIWIDDAVRYDMPLRDFFRNPGMIPAQIAPFDGPFTRHRSGAWLTHAQLRWTDRFIIGLDDTSFSNSARFHRIAATLASPEGDLPMPDQTAWETIANNPGAWPHQHARVPRTVGLVMPADGGADHILLHGPSTLMELTFEVSDPSAWLDLWARFTWDNAAQPQVDLPLRHLGGMASPPASFAMQSLLLDNDGQLRATCWFPMPFAESARIELVNKGPNPHTVRTTVCELPGEPEADWGYFTATHRYELTGTGEPFLGPRLTNCHGMLRALILEDLIDNSGRIPDMHLSHLEGDLCIRINGNRGDDHTFAASETSIGRWGWYLTPADVAFDSDTSFQSGPMARFIAPGVMEVRRIMGSTFVFDPVHFVDGIEIVLEHGVQNLSNAEYMLSAFFYVQPGRARATIAEIDIGNVTPGNPVSEPTHGVQFTAWTTYAQQGAFLRDQFFGTQDVTETVREVRDYLRFRVQPQTELMGEHGYAIGLRLDRLGGPNLGVCQADVFVDGRPAGLLNVFTHNAVFPWKEGGECEVELPRALTDGKSAFTVELRPRAGTDPLRVARLWVYEYLK